MEVVPSTMENLLSRTLVKVLERLFHKPTASWLDSLRKQSASRVRSGTRLINVLTFTASQHLFRRSEEHTSELQSQSKLVCRLLLEKKKGWTASRRPERHRHGSDCWKVAE